MSLISTVEQQSHHDLISQAVLQGCWEHSVTNHSEVTVHLCSIGQQQLHQLIPGQKGQEVSATLNQDPPSMSCLHHIVNLEWENTHLSARIATRIHRSGSKSVFAPAASNISAQVTSPLETAKYRELFLRSPQFSITRLILK